MGRGRRCARLGAMAAAVTMLAAGLAVTGVGPTPPASAALSPGSTQIVSVDSNEVQGDFFSEQPAISENGRYVAFATDASLDPFDTQRDEASQSDVYVRDLATGTTVLLSHGLFFTANGPTFAAGDGPSRAPSVSRDGRYVAFESDADNLGTGESAEANDPKIVLVDRDPNGDGRFDETTCRTAIPTARLYCHSFTRVNPAPDSDFLPGQPSLAADGSAVAWTAGGEGEDVWVSTVGRGSQGEVTGVASEELFIAFEDPSIGVTFFPVLSGNGDRIVFAGEYDDGNGGEYAVLGVDLAAGPLPDEEGPDRYPAVRLDVDGAGAPIGIQDSFDVDIAISGDGRFVAFETSTEFANDFGVPPMVRLVPFDIRGIPRSEVVSRDAAGSATHGADPSLSGDGRYVAFTTFARNVHNGVDGAPTECDPFVFEPTPAATPAAATGHGGSSGPVPVLPAAAGFPTGSSGPVFDGETICDVVVRDVVRDQERADDGLTRLRGELASPSLEALCVAALPPGESCEGDDASFDPVLSGDGSVVAYASEAEDLVPEDDNLEQDVFARTFTPRLLGDPLDFGPLQVGTTGIRSTTLRHDGFGPLPVTSVAVGGPGAAAFAVTGEACTGRVLHAGGTCAVSLSFAPTVAGPAAAVLEVGYRGLATPLRVPLTGSGSLVPVVPGPPGFAGPPGSAGAPVFSAAPVPLNFGERLTLAASPPATITVTNSGAGPMTITGVRRLPAAPVTDPALARHPEDFAILADFCTGQTLTAGQSCPVSVRHNPQGVGVRDALLEFTDTAPGSPQLIGLTGSGTAPRLEFNPAVVTDGRVTAVFGFGFAPLRDVAVTLRGFPERITARSDPNGNFVATLVIFPNSLTGERVADAVVVGHQPPIAASGARLLVVPGSVGPPDFLGRG